MGNREILIITPAVWQRMLELARAEAPLESCGLLAGIDFSRVERFYPMTNIDRSEQHFSMSPREQLLAIKDMRRRNLRMIGIWHSHPSGPLEMTREDLRLAFTPGVFYVILSLQPESSPVMVAFQVRNGKALQVPCRIG